MPEYMMITDMYQVELITISVENHTNVGLKDLNRSSSAAPLH